MKGFLGSVSLRSERQHPGLPNISFLPLKYQIHAHPNCRINDIIIAELVSDKIAVRNAGDALDLMANCYVKQAKAAMIYEKDIVPEFFDLKTGILGEILQEFASYGFRLAIVGGFGKFPSKNFQDFLYESNKGGRMIFVKSKEEALKRLTA